VVAAKTETVDDLVAVDRALRAAESAAGLPHGTVDVVPLLESAAAVLAARTVAGGPRVRRLQLGEADLRGETGILPGDDERELLYARSHLVLASHAAGLDAPVAPVSPNFRDLDRFRASTLALGRLGFVGRACIHPAQVEVANEVFTPAPEAVARARALIARFDRATAADGGVLVDDAGEMVDEAVVRQARLLLRRVR
jgi:citrate lyase subunit beta/citryl-CoA lyase